MKTTITIEDHNVKFTFTPENDLEKLCLRELGDDIGFSRSHQSLVLRQRKSPVRRVVDQDSQMLPELEPASLETGT